MFPRNLSTSSAKTVLDVESRGVAVSYPDGRFSLLFNLSNCLRGLRLQPHFRSNDSLLAVTTMEGLRLNERNIINVVDLTS